MPPYRSRTSTHGRNMAGARSLWRATGMTDADFGKPIIAIANSFTQFVPGHVHLHDVGQRVKTVIDASGGWGVEFNTIAIDDGIAMGHGGMLYSLPSRDLIADSVEYMVNAHCADALVCISNCDKITPGMLMAAMRLNIPTIFVSGGPMEAGKMVGTHGRDGKQIVRKLDLIDSMIASSDAKVSDAELGEMERSACPTCGSCSGMFSRIAALSMPGVILSQFEMHTSASTAWPWTMCSTPSAITSRLGSECSMPPWPIAMPSSTAIVLNSRPTPPASAIASQTSLPMSRRWT